MHVYIYLFISMYECMRAYKYVYACVNILAFVCVCVYVCVCVCVRERESNREKPDKLESKFKTLSHPRGLCLSPSPLLHTNRQKQKGCPVT